MRKIIALALVALMVLVWAAARAEFPVTGLIHLGWNYSSNSLCQDLSNNQMDWFRLYGTNSLSVSLSNWPTVYCQPWTNIVISGYDGTNFTFYAPFTVTPPGQFFFAATVSNFWGESGFSNTASVPYLPSTVFPSIFKN